MPSLYNKIGRNMRTVRKSKKLTQEELGKVLGVSKTAIVNYESAQRKISLDTIVKLCKFYEISVNDLICDYGSNTKKEQPELNDFFKSWNEELLGQEFLEDEIELIIEFAKLIIRARSVGNGESNDTGQE